MKNWQFVVCINNADYPASLELHKIYRVLQDQDAAVDGDIRVVDESGEDYLYPASYFTPIEIPKTVEESFLRPISAPEPKGKSCKSAIIHSTSPVQSNP